MDITAPVSEFSILDDDFVAEEIVVTELKCEENKNESFTANIGLKQLGIEAFIVPHEEPEWGIFPTNEIPTEKRKKHPALCKTTLRRQQRASGQMYISMQNKLLPARELKTPCRNCIFDCTNTFSAEERSVIFQSFWRLSDDEKNNFYNKFVTMNYVKKDCHNRIKQFSYKYFFEKDSSLRRVCRLFFLNTLSIDQNRIYYSFSHLKSEGISLKQKDKLKTVLDEMTEQISNSPEGNFKYSKETVPSGNKILLAKKRKQTLQRPKFEIGHVYVSAKNALESGKHIREACDKCSFKCSNNFSTQERTKIFNSFWSLNDEERKCFYNTFVTRDYVKCRRKNSRSCIKQYSYKYFLEKSQSLHRVCRVFFLNTLSIDQKRIYYCFKHLRNVNKQFALQSQNKKIIKCITSPDLKSEIPKQICSSFEIGSYYCRAKLPSDNESLLGRKRKINTSLWTIKARKLKREAEQTYVSTKKEIVSGRALKKPCNSCPYSCTNIFSTDQRINIFQLFWNLSADEKIKFYNRFVIRDNVKRRKKTSQTDIKQFSYKYFLEKNQSLYRVCRIFFLNTLCIDQKRIYYSFKHLQDKCKRSPLKRSKKTNVTAPEKTAKIENRIINISPLHAHYYKASVLSTSELLAANVSKTNPLLHKSNLRYVKREPGQRKMSNQSIAVLDGDVKQCSENSTSESKETTDCKIVAAKDLMESLLKYTDEFEQTTKSTKHKIAAGEEKKEKIQKLNNKSAEILGTTKNNLIAGRNVKEKMPKQTVRSMKEPCRTCPFECANKFSTEERIEIFQSFWSLSGAERTRFYNKFVIRDNVKRRKKDSQSDIKQFSYKYFLEKNQSLYRVCRVFFLHTLSIDQKRIYYSFNHLQNKDADPLL